MSKIRLPARAAAIAVLLLWLGASQTSGQSTSAAIFGTLLDEHGGTVRGASVSTENVANGQRRLSESDANGRYNLISLPPGVYRLRVQLPGFAPADRLISVTVAQELEVNLVLSPAGVEERVEVRGQQAAFDTRTSIGRTVLQEELESLPVVNRDFATLALLTPGILPNQSGNLNNASAIVAAGQSARSNTFMLDGASLDDTFQANPRGGVPLDAVREFMVLTDGYGAEYGQASGAIVSVVTRSGANRFDGGIGYLLRDRRLNAENPLVRRAAGTHPEAHARFSEHVPALSIGGPLRRDRAFFFGAVEGTHTVRGSVTASPALSVFRPGVSPVVDQRPWHWQTFGRLDSALGQGQLTVAYRLDRTAGASTAGGSLSPESAQDGELEDQDLDIRHRLAARQISNELASTASRRFWSFAAGDHCSGLCPPYSEVRGSLQLGITPTDGIRTTEHYWQFKDVLTALPLTGWGEHAITTGVSAMLVSGTFLGVANQHGTFRFANDAVFDARDPATYPINFTQTVGSPDVRVQHLVTGAFVQDRWTPRSRVAINLGARWDYDSLTGVAHDRNNLGPRVGVSIAPAHFAQMVIRGSYGVFYDQTFELPVRQYGQALQTTQRFVRNPDYGGWPSLIGPQEQRTDTRSLEPIDTPYSRRATLGLRRTAGQVVVSIDAAWGAGRHLLETLDSNPRNAEGIRPNPDYQVIRVVRAAGGSSYRGLEVGALRRLSRGYAFSAAYTFSSAAGNTEGFEFTPQDQHNPRGDWGPLTSDVRHQFVSTATVDLPWRLRLGSIVTIRSAAPYTIITGRDDNGDGINNDRPPGVPRNSVRGTGFFQLDARLWKLVPMGHPSLELSAEAFNLTNHANWAGYNGLNSSSTFRQPTAAGIPRQLQLGVHLRF